MGSIFRGCRGSAKSRLTDHFLSEYGFSLLMTLGAQFTAKRQVGGGEGVIRMLRNDTLRYLLESGGFVLEEVLQDAGFELKVRFMHVLSCNSAQECTSCTGSQMATCHSAQAGRPEGTAFPSGWRADGRG